MVLVKDVLIISLLFYFAATRPAAAYLDPGTGSIILQGLIGAIAGGLVIIRLYWSRVKNFFGKSSLEAGDKKEGRTESN